ncbi:amino acid ABC transporter substrate-binding protein [Thermodesulfobacteriota bacterium]
MVLFRRFIFIFFISVMAFLPSPVKGETLKIGATVSATGHFASEIGPFEKLLRSWADRVNERGGIPLGNSGRKVLVEFVIYDDQSQVPVVTRFYERLVQRDRVDILLGPYSSPLTFAATIPAERGDTPFLAICANSPKIYSRDFKWLAGVIDLAPRYTYRYWDMLAAEKRAGTVSFVVEDTMHPRGVYEGSKVLAQKAGLKVISAEIVPPDIQELGGIISRLREKNPDIIYVSSNIPLAISFMKQAREKGLKAREFHCIHHSGIFRDALGSGSEGVVGQSYWTEGMGMIGGETFLNLLKRSGIDPDKYPWAPAYMCAFQMVEEAVKRAGSIEKSAIMKAMKGAPILTLCGKNSVNEKGYGKINTYPSQILKGKYEIVWPREYATAKHVYPWMER